MTRDDIIRLRDEADEWAERHLCCTGEYHPDFSVVRDERFAALVAEHLRYDGIHSCHLECQRPACVAMREAVLAEREAIAQKFDGPVWSYDYREIAAAIRARGQHG